MNTNAKVSTKPSKDDAAIETNLTLNWDGMTEDDLRALAQQALIVKLQGTWRKGTIPTDATVNVIEHKVGTRAPKKTLLEQAAGMNAEQRAELIKTLTALQNAA